jgi:hypothetical protein
VSRIASFAYKSINNTNAPVVLKSLLTPALDPEPDPTSRQLLTKRMGPGSNKLVITKSRHPNALEEPFTNSSVGESTFAFSSPSSSTTSALKTFINASPSSNPSSLIT